MRRFSSSSGVIDVLVKIPKFLNFICFKFNKDATIMRLLMLSWEYPPNVVGGLGRHVAELAPALAQQGVNVHVATPTSSIVQTATVVEDGVTVHRVFAPALNMQAEIFERVTAVNRTLKNYVFQNGEVYDLVHVHDWLTGFAGIELQQTWGCPLIATVHATERGRARGHIGSDLQRAIDDAERSLINEATHLIVCSRFMANEVQAFFHASPSRIDVVPNGVNIDSLSNHRTDDDLEAFRANYAEPDDLIVFTVTRLVHEKGVHRLLEAAPRIFAACPQARIIVAGKGPEAKNLMSQVEQSGVSDRVNFVGFVSDEERNSFYKIATCAVFPSLYEPFGIVALEAMGLGCPVIVSDVGGLSEIIKHGENGLTIYPDNAESAAWGILHILQNPALAQEFAREAHDYVEEIFNWPRIARLTRAVYRRTLSKHRFAKANKKLFDSVSEL